MRHLCWFLLLAAVCWPGRLAAEETRRGVAVIVGIGDYVFLPDIDGVRMTVNEWEAFFESQRIEVLTVLVDTAASREAIEQAADRAVAEAAANDELWFVFVGHGAPSLSTHGGLLVGMDAQQTLRSLEARSVDRAKLLATLEAGGHHATRLVVDACFSGQTAAGDVLLPGSQPVIPVTTLRTSRTSTTVLAAAAANETAGPLPGQRRPGFSTALLEGLSGPADRSGDDIVTASEAVAYAARALRSVRGRTQTPQLAGDDTAKLAQVVPADGPAVVQPAPPAVAAPVAEVRPLTVAQKTSRSDRFPIGVAVLGYGVSAMYGGIAYYIAQGVAERNAQRDADRAAGVAVSDDEYEPQFASYLMGGKAAFFFSITTVALATHVLRKRSEQRSSIGFFAGDRAAGLTWSVRF